MIEVADYDESWPRRFAELRERYAAALAAADVPVLAIEHVGSTAVPGLAAKPVIDCEFGLAALAFLGTGPTAHHAGRAVHCDSIVVRMQTGPQIPQKREQIPRVQACERQEGVYAAGALLAAILCLTFGTGVRLSPEPVAMIAG